jgi:hypothetical protein
MREAEDVYGHLIHDYHQGRRGREVIERNERRRRLQGNPAPSPTCRLATSIASAAAAVFWLAGCAGSGPASLPDLEAGDDKAPGIDEAMLCRFDGVEESYLWIHGSLLEERRDALPWLAIQADGLMYPTPPGPYEPGERAAALAPVAEAIQEVLGEAERFRFLPTFHLYAGPGEVGGIVYLPDGRTLQETLLERGLAHVSRARGMGEPGSTIDRETRAAWIAIEDKARVAGRGFWTTHPERMRQLWDRVPPDANEGTSP